MGVTIALRIDPDDQTVDPGHEAVFTVHVVNQSGVVDRVALDVLGSAGGWARSEPETVALMPGTDATARIVVVPPLGTPLGPVPIGIRAVAETSGFVEVGEANLNVGASRKVQAELRPRTATGKRRATSVVVLHNAGNAPTKVQLAASDPDDAIVFDAPSAVQIGPGMTAELPLRMRLPSREKQGATLSYQVLVEGGDTSQALDGQVRQPAKKRWPVLAALMVLALLAAAFVLFKPGDAVAIKDGKAEEPTTPTVPGATTVVGATTLVGSPGPGADPNALGESKPGDPPGPGVSTTGPVTTAKPGPPPSNDIGPVIPTTSPTTARPPPPCPTPPASSLPTKNVPRNSSTVVVDTRLADADGSSITVDSVTRPLRGTAVIGADRKTITYTPTRDYLGPDELTYTVSDGGGGTASATLPLCVQR